MKSKNVKLAVFVPEKDAEKVRQAMGKAGSGVIGNYTFCSFSSKGVGRFLPLKGANPTIGSVGKLEKVIEEKIEVFIPRKILLKVIKAMKEAHPYEEVAYDVYALEN